MSLVDLIPAVAEQRRTIAAGLDAKALLPAYDQALSVIRSLSGVTVVLGPVFKMG